MTRRADVLSTMTGCHSFKQNRERSDGVAWGEVQLLNARARFTLLVRLGVDSIQRHPVAALPVLLLSTTLLWRVPLTRPALHTRAVCGTRCGLRYQERLRPVRGCRCGR